MGYNTGVKHQNLLSFARLLLPLLVAFVFPLTPEPNWLPAARLPGHTQDAELASARRLAVFEPWQVSVQERLGIALWKSGMNQEAVDQLRLAASEGGLSMESTLALATASTSLGDSRAAAAWMDLVGFPNIDEAIYQTSVIALRNIGTVQQLTAAGAAWQSAYPTSAAARRIYASCLSVQQPDRAADLLRKGQSLTATEKNLLSALDAMADTDDLARGWLLVGQALSQMNEWKLAAQAFQYSVDANPGYSEAWALLGEAREQSGQDGGSALQQAYVLNPESTVTLGLLALRERRVGNPGVALNYLNKAARLEPTKAVWQLELAAVYESLGNMPEAQTYLSAATRVEPGSAIVWQTIAAFALRNRANVEQMGLAAARQAVALAPQNPLTLETMGQVMFYLKDYQTARRYFETAITLDPQNPRLLYDLGLVYVQLNDLQSARHALIRAIQLAEDEQIRLAAQELHNQINGEVP